MKTYSLTLFAMALSTAVLTGCPSDDEGTQETEDGSTSETSTTASTTSTTDESTSSTSSTTSDGTTSEGTTGTDTDATDGTTGTGTDTDADTDGDTDTDTEGDGTTGAAAEPEAYGDPMVGCLDSEAESTAFGFTGSWCGTACDPLGVGLECPAAPEGLDAVVVCAGSAPIGGTGACALGCTSDDQCLEGATCEIGQTGGLCMFGLE